MRTHEDRAEQRSFDRMAEYYTFGLRLSHEEFVVSLGVGYRNLRKSRLRRERRISTSPTAAIPAP